MNIFPFLNYPHISETEKRNYTPIVDYLYLPEIHSVKKHLYAETVSLVLVILIIVSGLIYLTENIFNVSFLLIMSATISLFYLILMIFKLMVIRKAMKKKLISFDEKKIKKLADEDLPVYTILIPLYKEDKVIGQIVSAMTSIDYPKDKLDIIVTVEEYDRETRQALDNASLPGYFNVVVLPDTNPKTKPKALNVALRKAKGDFIVIYDAEIIPEPDQLKKAYLGFLDHPEIGAFQTRLDHYNAEQNLLTRLFNAEFSFYYDMFLPGLQELGFPLALSGHSVHFRKENLQKAEGWDPYNVAEDCDLGIRLRRRGFRTDILDSVSREEASSSLGVWMRQRTRWMKGFIQTSIVHLRHPFRFKDEIGGWPNFIGFLLVVPGTVGVNILNLLYWVLLTSWFLTESPLIKSFFPGPILYISIISFVLGNAIFTFLNLLGSYKRNKYSIVKYCLLSPAYWVLLAFATVRSFVHILLWPHHWEKTRHGDHIREVKEPAYENVKFNRRIYLPA